MEAEIWNYITVWDCSTGRPKAQLCLKNNNVHAEATSENEGAESEALENEAVCLISTGCNLCPKSTFLSRHKRFGSPA